jgi:hypothetical protein
MFNKDSFLSAVLPQGGSYCVVGLKKDEKPKQKFVGSIEEIGVLADSLVSNGYDAYYALASFADPKEGRTAVNASQLKSFFIDIDCGIGKPYADQAEGVTALKKFLKDTGLPKPTVVNSGRGVHAYWILDEAIPSSEWKPLAEKFKALCDKHNLDADPAVTADTARILRIPDTLNFKNPEDPQNVSILTTGGLLNLEVIKEVLNTVEVDVFAGMIGKPFIPREMDALTMQLMGNKQSRFKTIMIKSAEGTGCSQLLHIYENQSTIEEPLWRAGLSIAHACVDGAKAIHVLSNKHPEYNANYTEKKANETKGPYTCATFRKLNASGCEGCTLSLTSPIQLGKEIAEATEADNIVEEVTQVEDGKEETTQYVIPKFPFPYFRGKVGGIYVRDKGPDGEEVETNIYPYDFYIVKRMNDPDQGDVILARLHLPKDGVREFIMPMTSVVSKERFISLAASHGIAVLGKKQDALMGYVTRWVEELQATSKAEQARRQFGWLDSDGSFILGDKEITADEVKYSPPTSTTLPLVPMFQEKGDFRIWKDVVNAYARPEMEAKAFALFMGFGNVLLKYTNLEGYLLSLKSQGSGSGKTTILHAIASIYGKPKEPLMQVKDTYNQKMQRIGVFQNIPILMDEMTNMPPDQKSNLTYDITQGRAKNRMKSQENAERINITRWATGLITTSNRSLRDDLLSIKSFPEGELMRIMELHIFNDPNDDPQWARNHFSRLYDNYGHAAVPFLQYVIGHLPEVIEFLGKIQTKIETAADIKSNERYWSAMAATAIVGGIISKRLGLHDIDHKPVMEYIVKHIRDSRVQNKMLMAENSDFLGGFLQRHFHEILVINGRKDNKTGLETGPIREPRGALTARYEPDTKMLFVVAKSFRDECTKGQLNFEEATMMYKKTKALVETKKKRMAAGTVANTQAGVTALCFDTTKLEFFREEKFLNAKGTESDDSDSMGED